MATTKAQSFVDSFVIVAVNAVVIGMNEASTLGSRSDILS